MSGRDQLLHVSRQVAEGMVRVVRQERWLAELERSGYDTTNARAALATFKQILEQTNERRKEILLSLGQAARQCTPEPKSRTDLRENETGELLARTLALY